MLILPVKVHNFQKQGYGSKLVAFSGRILCMAPSPLIVFIYTLWNSLATAHVV